MKKLSALSGLLLLGSLSACEAGVEGEVEEIAPLLGAEEAGAIPGQYIVVMKDGTTSNLVADLSSKVGLLPGNKLNREFQSIPAFAAELTKDTLDEIRRNPDVAYVEQDQIVSLDTVHNTNGVFTNFNIAGLDRIDQRARPLNFQFNDLNRTGAGVHVYVLDTGILSAHQEFAGAGRIGGGFTAINDGFGAEDCNDHGSHVASIIGGNNVGVARGVTLHAVRVLDCAGSGSISGIIAGVDFARTNCPSQGGRCVANLSLGGGASTALDNAVTNAHNAGVVMVVAAGNENQNACNVSPARAAAAITVGATVPGTDARASFSNRGTCLDIFAPGVGIPGAASSGTGDYVAFDGTSQAAPHVAGVAAGLKGVNPGLSSTGIRNALVNSATTNVVTNAGTGSPNRLLFHNSN
jgi:subtilisin family serine protease